MFSVCKTKTNDQDVSVINCRCFSQANSSTSVTKYISVLHDVLFQTFQTNTLAMVNICAMAVIDFPYSLC